MLKGAVGSLIEAITTEFETEEALTAEPAITTPGADRS
jgi:hypothetical protein